MIGCVERQAGAKLPSRAIAASRVLAILALAGLASAAAALEMPYWKARTSYWDRVDSDAPRRVYLLDDQWEFLPGGPDAIDGMAGATQGWTPVTLPHAWGEGIEAGWYRRPLVCGVGVRGKTGRLLFEGVAGRAEVYVNDRRAGGQAGGLTPFRVEASPVWRTGENMIYVRIDRRPNQDALMPSSAQNGPGGGLIRHVWLELLPTRGIGGIRVRTPRVSAESASTQVVVETLGARGQDGSGTVTAKIFEPGGRLVARASGAPRSGSNRVTIDLPAVARPLLWSPENPQLYTVVVALDGRDETSDQFGYRWYEIGRHGNPSQFNGRPLTLHKAQAPAALMSGAPGDEQLWRGLLKIKNGGANFVELNHLPQSPAFYRACDELGLLVRGELPWTGGGVGGLGWLENAGRTLRELIVENANRPSILLWSLGRNPLRAPTEGHVADPREFQGVLRELADIAREADPGRPTAVEGAPAAAGIVDLTLPSP